MARVMHAVANRKVLWDERLREIWIQLAAGDTGGAVGKPLCAYHLFRDRPGHPTWGLD